MDLTAVQCANLTGVNVRSVNTIYLKLRDRITQWSESNASATPGLNAQLSAGALVTATAGQADHISLAKRPSTMASVSHIDSASDGVVGVRLFIRADQVYCALLNTAPPNAESIGAEARGVQTRTGGNNMGISQASTTLRNAESNSNWNEYQIGIDVKRDMRFKLKSATFQQAYHAGETDRIDAFGRFLRLRLGKFKGLRRAKFYFHLKESEYRYNHRRYQLYALLLGMLGETPIE